MVASSVAETAEVSVAWGSALSGEAFGPQEVRPNRMMIKNNISKRITFMIFPDQLNLKQCWKLYATSPRRQSIQLVL
jgi:hypothetical protein